MCERSPLFLIEAKLVTLDLLKRTLELFDLSFNVILYYHLEQIFIEREQKFDYDHFPWHKPCKLNFNILSDIDIYLYRLSKSCRLTKSYLRSLHASRRNSSHDFIYIDDEIYELIEVLSMKINQPWYDFQSTQEQTIKDESLVLFRRIFQLYQLIIKNLYGISMVKDSQILQPIVFNIIRLLLSITNKLKHSVEHNSSKTIYRNEFRIKPNDEVCPINPKSKIRLK